MKRGLIAIPLLLLATGLAACGGAPQAATQPTTASLPAVSTPTAAPTTVPTPEIALGASGIGEVMAAQDADLVFTAQGTVADVLVKAGDVVTKGQLLAMLDTRPFDQQLHQAEAALSSAQAQDAALTEGPRAADTNAARAQVQQAQAALAQLKSGPKTPDLQSAQAALVTAQTNLQAMRDRLSLAKTQADAQIQQLALTLTQAQARYGQAKSNWDYVQETGNDPIVPNTVDPQTGKKKGNHLSDAQREGYYSQFVQAEAALHQAEQAVEQGQVVADNAHQSEITGVQIAEQAVVQAQAAVDRLTQPPDRAQLSAAQAALAQAQAAQARLNPDPRDSQKALVAAGIAQAQASLELAKLNREHAEIRAPFDGTVAAVNIDPGDPSTIVGQPAIKVVDVSTLRVEVQFSDTDIAGVSVGQQAEVRADALPDKVLTGKVSFIAPTATVQGTIRSYLVKIALDAQQGLRAGMSVRVDLVTK